MRGAGAGAQAERFQHLEADLDLLFGLRREADADRIADPGPQQIAHPDARLDRPADQPAGLGNSQMERAIDRLGQLHIGRHGEEYVAGLHRHLVFVEIVVLQQLDVIERALDDLDRARRNLVAVLDQSGELAIDHRHVADDRTGPAPGENAVKVDSEAQVTRNDWIDWAENAWWHDIKETDTLNVGEGRGENDTAADGDGLAPQAGIEQLLDRSVESIEVGMKDGG